MTRRRTAKSVWSAGGLPASRRPSGGHETDPDRRCANGEFALACFYALAWLFGIVLLALCVVWILTYP